MISRACLIVVVLFACAGARALADGAPTWPEHCPATIADGYSFAAQDPGLFAFRIGAETPRTVTGNVLVRTNAGWFSIPFPYVGVNVPNKTASSYDSKPIYARFPSSVTSIDHWWVSDASSIGDGMGWQQLGTPHCLPPQTASAPRISAEGAVLPAIVVAAVPTAEPWPATCAKPDQSATPRKAVAPVYPYDAMTMNIGDVQVKVEVETNSDGSLAAEGIYESSQVESIDKAALHAAYETTYEPARVLCMPTWGDYLFTADFNRM